MTHWFRTLFLSFLVFSLFVFSPAAQALANESSDLKAEVSWFNHTSVNRTNGDFVNSFTIIPFE